MDIEKNEVVTEEVAAPVEKNEASAPSARPAMRPNKRRKKVCAFCADNIDEIDYKAVSLEPSVSSGAMGKALSRAELKTLKLYPGGIPGKNAHL